MVLNFENIFNIFRTTPEGFGNKIKENVTFEGDVTIDVGAFPSGSTFLVRNFINGAGPWEWIKVDGAQGQMEIGDKVGGDWTEINFHGIVGFADATVSGLPGAGTKYWSCPGLSFRGTNPDTDQLFIGASGNAKADANVITFWAPVYLPHGAVVTAVVVYGDNAARAETWTLYRIGIDAGTGDPTAMATANIDTQDTSISNATIDNQNYIYFFKTSSLDLNDEIYGARITYTL